MLRKFVASAIIFCLLSFPLYAQTKSRAGQDQDEVIKVGTNEVVLDTVIRDKKGRAIRDINPSEIEVYEDGVLQHIQSMRLLTEDQDSSEQPTPAVADVAGAAPPPAGAPRRVRTTLPSAIAIVFDRLSPDARVRARQAALAYVGEKQRSDDYVGIFGIDLSLRTILSFTNNNNLIRQAIDGTAQRNAVAFGNQTDSITNGSDQLGSSQAVLSGLTDAAGPGAQNADAIGTAAAAQTFAEMTQRAQEAFERMEHNQQGYATTDGLLAIISALARMPGRKALVLFSEGIKIPPEVADHFKSVIGNANRANVSIYAVDAAGLRGVSTDSSTSRAMVALGRSRLRQAGSAQDDTNGPMSRDLERNEDLLRLDPASGLGDLANETGGTLISNTNNPGQKLKLVNEDLHTHYVLTYKPVNQNFDGKFRVVNIKVNRSGLEVQTRKGYYALDTTDESPLLAYEAAALAILSGKPQPNSFEAKSGAFSFPEARHPGLVPVLVRIPGKSVTFTSDNKKHVYHTDFSVVALVKDAAQRVITKLSNQYVLSGPLAKVEAAKAGEILFYREAELQPGSYTVAVVVYDAISGRASSSSALVTVPAADTAHLRLSSIVFVATAERLTALDQQRPNPFHFGEVLVYPALGDAAISLSSKRMTVFTTAYPGMGNAQDSKLLLEIISSGRVIGKSSYELPAPDASGAVQYASTMPIDKMKPGAYEVRVTVQYGSESAAQTAPFTIVK